MCGIFIILALLKVTEYRVQASGCEAWEIPKAAENHPCLLQIQCYEAIDESVSKKIHDLPCIYEQRNHCDDYGNCYYDESEQTYEAYLEINNIDVQNDEDPLQYTYSLSTSLRKLMIFNSNLVEIPQLIYSLYFLNELDIVDGCLEKLNLHDFIKFSTLNKLNMSHNAISQIYTNSGILPASSVESIDLSFNKIEFVPDGCFSPYTGLTFLDLSNNLITEFDILTFEGLSQLEILKVSNNNLKEIGRCFERFHQLNELDLDNNNLVTITNYNFKSLLNLRILNISSNLIDTVDVDAFYYLANLQQLDLSYNHIKIIKNTLFSSNNHLSSLLLNNNQIEHIEDNSFVNKTLINFTINNNLLNGSINEMTWEGIYVTELDLSGGKLEQLNDRAFSKVGSLQNLNLSSNAIFSISYTSFRLLDELIKLDLSYNKISSLDFDKSDLRNVTELYLNNNNIDKILNISFSGMFSLLKLDLSKNNIAVIETNSFRDLKKINEINLSGNKLNKHFPKHLFETLHRLRYLFMAECQYVSLSNESFYDMKSIKLINSSSGALSKIEYEAFNGAKSVDIIDLSNNMLKCFNVNTSHLGNVEELYLNNNNLKEVSANTFFGLRKLAILNLAYNQIITFHPRGLQSLKTLNTLNLSYNNELEIDTNVFNDLSLSEVSLKHIKKPINNFDVSKQIIIETLLLSDCNISDINLFQVYNIKKILKLDLNSNNISLLNKESLKNMTSLNLLDISSNVIHTIQPGTFLQTNMIHYLYLQGNRLQSVEFGVLDGLSNLRLLNLSSNLIQSFSENLLHSISHLNTLLLDNNYIMTINLGEFVDTSVTKISLGNNSIACDDYVSFFRRDYEQLTVTAEILNFHSENVKGITCKNKAHQNSTSDTNTEDNDVSFNQLTAFNKSLENMNKVLTTILNENMKYSHDEITNLTNILADIMTKMQINSNDQLKTVIWSVNNSLNFQSKTIKDNQNSMNKALESVLAGMKRIIYEQTNLDQNNYKQWQLSVSNLNNSLNYYLKNFLVNVTAIYSSNLIPPTNDVHNFDSQIKVPLYIIVLFLGGLTLSLILIYIKFCYYDGKRDSLLNNSHSQPLNVLEMG